MKTFKMDEKSTKISDDWMRCPSKTRAGQFYMFNKTTGENYWCSDPSSDATQQNHGKTKTPAQDRLKRLQKQLSKKQTPIPKAKDSTRVKKSGTPTVKQTEKEIKETNNPLRGGIKESLPVEEVGDTKTTLTMRLQPKEIVNKDVPVASIRSETQKFIIPKKQQVEIQNSSPRKKSVKRKQTDIEPITVSPKLKRQETTNDNKPNSEQKPDCDINDNEKSPATSKPGVISVFKNCCTSIFKQIVPKSQEYNLEEATKQSGLSLKTTHSGKFKKYPLQDNQSEKPPIPSITAKPPEQEVMINTRIYLKPLRTERDSSKNQANERLQRLRKSLQNEQNENVRVPTVNIAHFNETPKDTTDREYESMDWQPICEESNQNSTLSYTSAIGSSEWDTVNENLIRLAAQKNQQKRQWKTDHFYFVIDTNIIIENVTFIDELTSLKFCDTAGTVIYIPYCVLQELDNLKHRETIKVRTTRAIQFLNKSFEKKSQYFQAQSSAEENNHLIKVRSSDDSILNCCIQVRKHIENVMLLTDDINLRNKAICSNILVSTRSDLMSKHESQL